MTFDPPGGDIKTNHCKAQTLEHITNIVRCRQLLWATAHNR